MRRALLLALLLAAPAAAQEVRLPALELPVLEAGIGGGGGWLPDYPAAEQNHVRGIGTPFVIYRGELLRADDQGLRGRLMRGDRLGLDLSFSGAFPASSRNNRAREGMPDLDWQGEVGPALRLTLWRDKAHPRRVNIELPVRAVFSSDLSSTHYRGVVVSPELAFEDRDAGRRIFGNLPFLREAMGLRAARFRAGVGPIFATERLHDLYYEVEPQYARPGRPAYRARAGYLGTRLQFSIRVPLTPALSFIGGGRVENFAGAANADSPLHRRDWNTTVAVGFAWSLYRSAATVASSADPFD
ncbi:MipA/OmpV family protein [Muricoccus nepalensis]|uniref:MipA/OmpV family protein n=1 Tax=Muricoccus nepalensis TaxID=1854500 RepID=UPI001386BB6B|nr:MipA/OmpV family protein [Roseomonas nepalensis]